MKPERARELFSDYAEDALTPAMRLALDQHFDADPASRADYDQFARVYALLEADVPEMVDVPLGFRAKVLENVAAEQARRESAPAHRAAQSITGWWRALGTRRAGAGVLAALGACAVAAVFLAPHVPGPNQGSQGFGVPTPLMPTTITGVNYVQDASGSQYSFLIHLPANVPRATVSADILTGRDQIQLDDLITDADTRVKYATPALTPPQTLTNDEFMEIPVTLPHPAPAGTTLNMLVQWTPGNGGATNSQVVFTPSQPGVPAASIKPLPSSTDFYDALEYVAASTGVTVIADAADAPTQTITPPTGQTVDQQLQSIASQVNFQVQKLPGGAYEVSLPQQ